jgi:hypothetical protein
MICPAASDHPPLAAGCRKMHIWGNSIPTWRGPSMTTFDDRENAFENKFAHDEEMKFKAEARANKLLGLWAAELLGKSGDDADAYAREVIKADFEEAGHDDVIRKVAADLDGKASAEEISVKRAQCLAQAKQQLMSEG